MYTLRIDNSASYRNLGIFALRQAKYIEAL
jgi:hypothetical protein